MGTISQATLRIHFVKQYLRNSINISLTFVPEDAINIKSPQVQVITWRRKEDTPLCESMMIQVTYT